MKSLWLILITVTVLVACSDSGTGTQTLPAPGDVRIQRIGAFSVKLEWSDTATGEDGYRIDRRIENSDWVEAWATLPPDSECLEDTGLPVGIWVFYRVGTLTGETVTWAPDICISTDFPVPAAPVVIPISEHQARIQWIDVCTFEDGYILMRKTGGVDATWSVVYTSSADETSWIDTDIELNHSYSYRIACVADSHTGEWSPETSYTHQTGLFGGSLTFEVITWNLQNFPKAGSTTVQRAADMIEQMAVDCIALQEIEGESAFWDLVQSCPGWQGYRAGTAGYSINLAWMYNTSRVQADAFYEIHPGDSRPFPRAPLVMECSWEGIDLVLINNHFKAGGNGMIENDPWDEETRRQEASQLLQAYIGTNFPDRRVIVVGDLNDEIQESESRNVFWNFIEAPDFVFADMDVATGPPADWSYPSWPSHLDHILISDELYEAFSADTAACHVIQVDDIMPGGWSSYDDQVSDHLPTGLRIPLN